jgi:phospholipid-binding lipoprotein MlaA
MVWLLAGCATDGNPRDPLEGFNRAMFAFNEGLDKVLVKPVAQVYDAALPLPARSGVSNAFSNAADPMIAVNNLLQGKPAEALSDIGRVLINSTLGIFGLFDVATEFGLDKHEEDIGQTLGRWGVGDGAYLVLPVLGPRTVRDTFGWILDVKLDPVWQFDHVPTRNTLTALRFVDARANLLPTDKVIEEAALDKYSYLRNAYLQRRRNLIYDGDPPRERFEDNGGLDAGAIALAFDARWATDSLMLIDPQEPSPEYEVDGVAGVPSGDREIVANAPDPIGMGD